MSRSHTWGQARHRICRCCPDELGQDPDAPRGDPAQGLGRIADRVCDRECRPVRGVTHDAAAAKTPAGRRGGDGQSARASRPARRPHMPRARGSCPVSAAVFARSQSDRGRLGIAETTRPQVRAADCRQPPPSRPPRSVSDYATPLSPMVRSRRLPGSTQVICGVRSARTYGCKNGLFNLAVGCLPPIIRIEFLSLRASMPWRETCPMERSTLSGCVSSDGL